MRTATDPARATPTAGISTRGIALFAGIFCFGLLSFAGWREAATRVQSLRLVGWVTLLALVASAIRYFGRGRRAIEPAQRGWQQLVQVVIIVATMRLLPESTAFVLGILGAATLMLLVRRRWPALLDPSGAPIQGESSPASD